MEQHGGAPDEVGGRGATDGRGDAATGEGDAATGDAPPGGFERREPPELVKKLQERRERYRERGLIYRVAWVTAALIVIAAGIVMIIFPGPALVVIPIGLAMLSLEFAWAQRLLDKSLERGLDAKDIALNASPKQKIAGIVAIVCAIAAVAAVALIYFI